MNRWKTLREVNKKNLLSVVNNETAGGFVIDAIEDSDRVVHDQVGCFMKRHTYQNITKIVNIRMHINILRNRTT